MAKAKFSCSAFFIRIVREWNDLPEWVVGAGNLACFKPSLESFLNIIFKKPRSNPKKNVVLSIYGRHQEVLTLPENSVVFVITFKFDVSDVITGILHPMHALRSFISPGLYCPLLL